MITSPLLEKSRRINQHLQKDASRHVDFNKLAEVLKDLVQANTYIADSTGKILGWSQLYDVDCELLFEGAADDLFFTKEFCRDFLMKDDREHINVHQKNKSCLFVEGEKCSYSNRYLSTIPIIWGDKRLGTLFLARFEKPFNTDDLVLLEIKSIVVGMEMYRLSVAMKNRELRQRNNARLALDTLSYSEYQAIKKVLEELDGERGFLVASRIADELGITRSVIVNAIRKFESAGVIESRSLGMKGTHIRVLNTHLWEFLDK